MEEKRDVGLAPQLRDGRQKWVGGESRVLPGSLAQRLAGGGAIRAQEDCRERGGAPSLHQEASSRQLGKESRGTGERWKLVIDLQEVANLCVDIF